MMIITLNTIIISLPLEGEPTGIHCVKVNEEVIFHLPDIINAFVNFYHLLWNHPFIGGVACRWPLMPGISNEEGASLVTLFQR